MDAPQKSGRRGNMRGLVDVVTPEKPGWNGLTRDLVTSEQSGWHGLTRDLVDLVTSEKSGWHSLTRDRVTSEKPGWHGLTRDLVDMVTPEKPTLRTSSSCLITKESDLSGSSRSQPELLEASHGQPEGSPGKPLSHLGEHQG